MYIVEVKAKVSGAKLFVESLTATSASFTNDWKRAERFSVNEVGDALCDRIEQFDVVVEGFEAI